MKKVLVTGGANGIGRAIADSFLTQGEQVVIFDLDTRAGEEFAAHDNATFIEVNLASAEATQRAVDEAYRVMDDIDIIINNAGVSVEAALTEIDVEQFECIIGINLRSAFITSREMARRRDSDQGRAKYGRIINIASTRWLQSEPGWEAYAASKGGVVAMTHALALSLAQYNITVNSIAPGWIDTGHYDMSPEDHSQHPSGRVGRVDDIVRTCMFLCDEHNDFINGENIVVDGGMTKKMIYR